MGQLTSLLRRAACTVSDAADTCRAWEDGGETAPANRYSFLWEAAEATDDAHEAVIGMDVARLLNRYPKSRGELLVMAARLLVLAGIEDGGTSKEFEMSAAALGMAADLDCNLTFHESYNSDLHIARARASSEVREGMPLAATNKLYAHGSGRDGFIIRPEAEIILDEILLPTKIRRNLQCLWWTKLVAKPEAHLHRHIKPGRFSWYEGAPILPGLSLHYSIWCTHCEISLHIDDGGEAGRSSDWTNAVFQRLLAHRDEIDASFGAALEWTDNDFITFRLNGGFMCPDQEWDEIIDRQVEAMNRLHAAFTPNLGDLPEV